MKVEEIKLAFENNRETYLQFALIDNMNSHIVSLKKYKKDLTDAYLQIIKAKELAKQTAYYVRVSLTESKRTIDNFSNQAKELGVAINSFKEYTELIKIIDDSQGYLDKINKDIQ